MDGFDEVTSSFMNHLRNYKLVIRTHIEEGHDLTSGLYHHFIDLFVFADGMVWRATYYGHDGRCHVPTVSNFPGLWYRSFAPSNEEALRETLIHWTEKHPLWVDGKPNVHYWSSYQTPGSERVMESCSIRMYAQLITLWALLRKDHEVRMDNRGTLMNRNSERPPKDVIMVLSEKLNGFLKQEEKHIDKVTQLFS
jgi:hypothetical protein